MVWVGRDFIDHLIPPPLPPDQGAQSPVQAGLDPGPSACEGERDGRVK